MYVFWVITIPVRLITICVIYLFAQIRVCVLYSVTVYETTMTFPSELLSFVIFICFYIYMCFITVFYMQFYNKTVY